VTLTPPGPERPTASDNRGRPLSGRAVSVILDAGSGEGGSAGAATVWTRRTTTATACVLVIAAAAAWGVRRRTEAEDRRLRGELALARVEAAGGRHLAALRRLAAVERGRPRWGEPAYLAGLYEQARGRLGPALAAWSRVPAGSPYEADALALRGRGETARGRLAEAERLLLGGLARYGPGSTALRKALANVYRFEGRPEAARALALAALGDPDTPGPTPDGLAAALADLWDAEHEATPVAYLAGYLAALRRDSPDDDRVWLGLAWLATRSGRLVEADRLLADCEARRPGDEAVARARLDWALAADRPGAAAGCLGSVPAADPVGSAVLVHRLRSRVAAARGDLTAERRALEALVLAAPADLPALDRLAAVALAQGRAADAAALRARKDSQDARRTKYARLLGAPDRPGRARELAGLAADLGRRAESRWWARLAGDPPSGAVMGVTAGPGPGTLADLAPDLLHVPTAAGGGARAGATATAPTPSPIRFDDDAAAAGLTAVFDNGRSPARHLPETMSGGVGLLDYDGDGWLDVYLPQGGAFPPPADAPAGGDRLYRNLGDGTFENRSGPSGVAALAAGYGHGVAVGDVDNDGDPDVLLTRWRRCLLLENLGGGRFADGTDRAGLGGDLGWPTSAAFADLDGDGDLDLYVCQYLEWDADEPRRCAGGASGEANYCTPTEFRGLPDRVYRNDGGRFVDVSGPSGVAAHEGRGLGVLAADLDGDGLVDLYVANDMSANDYYRNLGGCRFAEEAHLRGLAAGASGGGLAGMGVAAGDLDGDGRLDLVVTNFFNESTTLYRDLGGGQYADRSQAAGLAALSRDLLGFGVALADFDDDGRLDLLSANGHVNDGRPRFPYAMPAQLLRGISGGRFADAAPDAGAALLAPHVGRGLAVGDLDNDGRLDALLVAQGEPPVYLHNRTPRAGNHSLTLALRGTRSNRDGVGARVTVRAGGRESVAQRVGGGSYLSAGDPRLHFGLGAAGRVDSVEVRWPSGRVDRHESLPADAGLTLVEGESAPRPLAGWPR